MYYKWHWQVNGIVSNFHLHVDSTMNISLTFQFIQVTVWIEWTLIEHFKRMSYHIWIELNWVSKCIEQNMRIINCFSSKCVTKKNKTMNKLTRWICTSNQNTAAYSNYKQKKINEICSIDSIFFSIWILCYIYSKTSL